MSREPETGVPAERLRTTNDRPVRAGRGTVLYWMTAARRLDDNHALERAAGWARELGRPLVILEALRVAYGWASDRLHRFVLDGMAEHRARLEGSRVLYHPYVEPEPGAGSGLLEALAGRACVVVTDDWPCFFLPRMLREAAQRIDVRMEAVDANGLYPMRATERVFTTAHSFRRHLQRELPRWLDRLPREHPLTGDPLPRAGPLPAELRERWPAAGEPLLRGDDGALARLPIDHDVPPAPYRGGSEPAAGVLSRFLEDDLHRYADERDHPDAEASSGLSPWVHFGHVSAHRIFREVARAEGWTPDRLAEEATGSREGWWGMSPGAEAFLDELVTWRELGFNRCALTDDYDRYASLPEWARETLEAHAVDAREHVYDLAAFEEARTHDPLWNAAQRQLRGEGRIHNYLRMLWGKKILEWTRGPREALGVMIHLNDRWAVDGRDPNSYSGIFWCLGRYDRGWPERPVFGKVRCMTSASTRRKLKLDAWLERWGG
ncbi:MAG TPA: deoxyribodipyrimidine photolyase [Gemmatimonadota bacterium]|nr:deoxyribodipyrimidine photolyase [Gemmatimonadota bacterium]